MKWAEIGANKYSRMWYGKLPIERDEFVSAAYCGLVEAARRYVPGGPAKFTTFAFYWTDRFLKRVPMEYRRQNGWTWHTAGQQGGAGANKMERVLKSVGWPTVKGNDGEEQEWDPPAPALPENVDDTLEKKALRERVLATASTQRDKVILKGRLDGRTLEDIGQELGITRERVRQLFERAYANAKERLSA